jgi:hypothetical protein
MIRVEMIDEMGLLVEKCTQKGQKYADLFGSLLTFFYICKVLFKMRRFQFNVKPLIY